MSIEFIEKLLSLLKVARIEALGEPVVDLRKHRARLVPTPGVAK
jgi:hypothetical protein